MADHRHPDTQEKFLQHIRDGQDRAGAAQAVGCTATQFKRLTNPDSMQYDSHFAAAYLDALSERDQAAYNSAKRTPRSKPRTTTHSGHTIWKHIPEQDIDRFLELVRLGTPRDLAAREIDTSLHQINRRANHDPEFAGDYHQALKDGYPNYQELLRGEAFKQAIQDRNYHALRDLLVVNLPEYAALRKTTHALEGNVNVLVEQTIQHWPAEIRAQMIQLLEEAKKHPDIDQQQLPPAATG